MSEIVVVATLKAKPGFEKELLTRLTALIEPTRSEVGCLRYELNISSEDNGTYLFVEEWKSRPLWEEHMNTPHLKAFGEVQADFTDSWELFVGAKA